MRLARVFAASSGGAAGLARFRLGSLRVSHTASSLLRRWRHFVANGQRQQIEGSSKALQVPLIETCDSVPLSSSFNECGPHSLIRIERRIKLRAKLNNQPAHTQLGADQSPFEAEVWVSQPAIL